MSIAILLICHRQMATYLKDTAVNLSGVQKNFETIGVLPIDGIESTMDKITLSLTKIDSHIKNILVFVDIFGGTPCNAAAKFFRGKTNITTDIITGVNLPMILIAIAIRGNAKNFGEFLGSVKEEAKKNIISLKDLNLL
ncbi:MAG: hypothetical protein GY817_00135 [bacterium]|nr:hypothetical protein [bacterium]